MMDVDRRWNTVALPGFSCTDLNIYQSNLQQSQSSKGIHWVNAVKTLADTKKCHQN